MAEGNNTKAKQIFTDALKKAMEVKNSYQIAVFQNGLGSVALQMAQSELNPMPHLDEARDYFQKALPVLLEYKEAASAGTCYTNIGTDYLTRAMRGPATESAGRRNLLDTAEKNYLRAISWLQNIEKQQKDKSQNDLYYTLAATHSLLSAVYTLENATEKALVSAEEGVRYSQRQDQITIKGMCCLNAGSPCLTLGLSEKARSYFQAAVGYFTQMHNPVQATKATIMMGAAQADLGMWDSAQETLETTLKSMFIQPAEKNIALYNLGIVYMRLGKWDAARETLENARRLMESFSPRDNVQFANVLDNLSNVYAEQNQNDQALEMKLRALELRRKYGGQMDVAYSLGNLGVLYSLMGNFDAAERNLLDATQLAVAIKNSAMISDASNALGNCYLVYKKLDKAALYYRQGLQYAEKSGDPQKIAASLSDMGYLYEAQGERAKAQDYFLRSLRTQKDLLDNVLAFATESEIESFLATLPHAFEALLISLCQENASPASVQEAFLWTQYRKGVVLNTLAEFRRRQALIAGDVTLRTLQEKLIKARKRNTLLNLAADERVQVSKQVEADEAELRRAFRQKYPQKPQTIVFDSLLKKLSPNAALIEFVRVDFAWLDSKSAAFDNHPHYLAFILKADSKLTLMDVGETEKIDQAIAEARTVVNDFSRDYKSAGGLMQPEKLQAAKRAYQAKGSALYQLVFAPLKDTLGKATMLSIAPDGELNCFPFEALPDQAERYLVETYHIAYLTSARDLLRSSAGPGRAAAAFIAPNFDAVISQPARAEKPGPEAARAVSPGDYAVSLDGQSAKGRFEPLGDLEAYAQKIGRLLVTTPLTGDAARKESFLALRSPAVLHILTHGFYVPQPETAKVSASSLPGNFIDARLNRLSDPMLRSGIALAGANRWKEAQKQGSRSDGWVSSAEMALMDLSNTELVTLAACETGLGEVRSGEGVYGLKRALFLAGTRSLLMSLFEVPNQETVTLTQLFYTNLTHGRSRIDSLREAQIEILHRPGCSFPFFWAGFVLVGETGPIHASSGK